MIASESGYIVIMLSPTATIIMSLIISTLVGFAGGSAIYFVVSFCICTIGIIESFSSKLKDKEDEIWTLKKLSEGKVYSNPQIKKSRKRKKRK